MLQSKGYVIDPIKTFSTGLQPPDWKFNNLTTFDENTRTWDEGNTLDTCDESQYWGSKPLPPFDRARVAMFKGEPPFDDTAFVKKLTSLTAMRTWNYKDTFCQVYDHTPTTNQVSYRNLKSGKQEASFEVTTR